MEVTYNSRCSLILDDNPVRYPHLIEVAMSLCYPYCDKIVIVSTSKRAIDELSKEKEWNIIMLDHDLDGSLFLAGDAVNTGFEVAKYIKNNHVKYNACIVHTSNDYVIKKMMEELKGTGNFYYKPCIDLGEYEKNN